MEVFITKIKENLYLFNAGNLDISEVEEEYVLDVFVSQIKTWIKAKTGLDCATYCISNTTSNIDVIAIVGDICSCSKILGKEIW